MNQTKNTKLRARLAEEPMAAKNELVRQYEPLINKMVHQYHCRIKMPWNDLKSMAYEGLALAINQFDPNRSKMNFTQFAAFAIRNNILTCINSEMRTVRITAYTSSKPESKSFNTVSLTTITGETGGEDSYSREGRYGLYTDPHFDEGNVYEHLYQQVDAKFDDRSRDIFYLYFGLKGFKETQLQLIAKKYSITSGRASQILNTVIRFIRKNNELKEILLNLLKK